MHIEEIAPEGRTDVRVMILPSNGACAEFYRGLGRALASRQIHVSLTTLPGFDSTPPVPNPGWNALVEAILPEVEQRLCPGGILVGHSLGGLLALLIAARLGDRLNKLVLMEPAIIPWHWAARLGASWYRRREIDDPIYTFQNRGPGFWRVHDVASFPASAFACIQRSSENTDRATLLGLARTFSEVHPLPLNHIHIPVCTIRGRSSGILQWISQKTLSYYLPVKLEISIDRAGHWLANEQDQAIAEAIARFAALAP